MQKFATVKFISKHHMYGSFYKLSLLKYLIKMLTDWEFHGGPVVRTSRFHGRGHGFNP